MRKANQPSPDCRVRITNALGANPAPPPSNRDQDYPAHKRKGLKDNPIVTSEILPPSPLDAITTALMTQTSPLSVVLVAVVKGLLPRISVALVAVAGS